MFRDMAREIAERDKAELRAIRAFDRHAKKAIEAAQHIAHWGDGHGGYLKQRFADLFDEAHGPRPVTNQPAGRPPIPSRVRKAVYERDEYRCRRCGTHKDLSIDHIHPYSLGGSDHPDNLQTLCLSCNCSKGARV